MTEQTLDNLDIDPTVQAAADEEMANQAQEETQQEEQTEAPQEQQQAKPSQQENFANLRKARERAERERDDMYQRLQQLEQSAKNNANEDDEPQLAPDDLVEWKYVQKQFKKLEQKLAQSEQRSYTDATEARLKAQYPDFDNVVNSESIEVLREQFPELAHSIQSNNDLYTKAVSAYTLVKKLGIIPEDKFVEQKQRVAQNMSKPKAAASAAPSQGSSALSKAQDFAGGLTPELKKQLYREMVDARKKM